MQEDENEELDVPVVKKRNPATEVDFHGLRIFVVPLYGENKLQISYREERKASAKKKSAVKKKGDALKNENKRLLQRQYRVPDGVTLTPEEPLSEAMVFETLEKVMPKFFLPKFFKKHPKLRTDELKLHLIGRYSLIQLTDYWKWSLARQKELTKALEALLELWGELPLKEVSPELCGPILVKVEVRLAKDIVTVLRHLFGFIAPSADNCFRWKRYQLGRKTKYSHGLAIQKRLLNQPFTYGEIGKILKLCEENAATDSRYLVAMTMLLCGLTVEEACGLPPSALRTVEEAKALKISQIVSEEGERVKGEKHFRKQRHHVKLLQQQPQLRVLGISDYLYEWWQKWKRKNKEANRMELLLQNEKNQDRVMHPKVYEKWLNDTFSPLVKKLSVVLDEEDVEASQSMGQRFGRTAYFLIEQEAVGCPELVRYYFGLNPSDTMAINYVGFDAPKYLEKMGSFQTKVLKTVEESINL
ncbi:hypothetical protein RFF05_12640 [Bengtsoniella intestinalis]|uniref:hypothetical protein n=1 Tax=Bengtsoniella intestinalis TaxID=3073143 RepID=UPI00391FB7B0